MPPEAHEPEPPVFEFLSDDDVILTWRPARIPEKPSPDEQQAA